MKEVFEVLKDDVKSLWENIEVLKFERKVIEKEIEDLRNMNNFYFEKIVEYDRM